jgi:transmembrane sensor
MSAWKNTPRSDAPHQDRLAQAADWFVRLRAEEVCAEDLSSFSQWLEQDRDNAAAYQRVTAGWSQLDACASAPEIVVARRDALESARRASAQRWNPSASRSRWFARAAVIVGMAVALGVALQSGFAQRGSVHETGLGERRILTLSDGSTVTLDARSRMRVTYSDRGRSIALEAGQARFDVAKDPVRPFVVHAGRQTVQALGTQFTVDLMADTVMVTLIEGQVAVTGARGTASSPEPVKMLPGEQLVARGAAAPQLRSNVDVARATSWQAGKLFFDDEPLESAAARMNRYALEPIEIDPSAGDVSVSGIFNAGDVHAFTEAVTTYFPVRIEPSDGPGIRLTAR